MKNGTKISLRRRACGAAGFCLQIRVKKISNYLNIRRIAVSSERAPPARSSVVRCTMPPREMPPVDKSESWGGRRHIETLSRGEETNCTTSDVRCSIASDSTLIQG